MLVADRRAPRAVTSTASAPEIKIIDINRARIPLVTSGPRCRTICERRVWLTSAPSLGRLFSRFFRYTSIESPRWTSSSRTESRSWLGSFRNRECQVFCGRGGAMMVYLRGMSAQLGMSVLSLISFTFDYEFRCGPAHRQLWINWFILKTGWPHSWDRFGKRSELYINAQ